MPDLKFSVSFRRKPPSVETLPQSIVLTPIPPTVASKPRYNSIDAVPFHAAGQVNASTTPDCYLQIWELDYFQTSRFLLYEGTIEESDLGPRRNQRIAVFPGVVVRESNKSFAFRSIGEPTLATPTVDLMKGKAIIALQPAGDTKAKNYEIPLNEFETVFELAATIRIDLADNTYERLLEIPPHQIRNVQASLRRQIAERGGLAIAFVADYRPFAANDIKNPEFHQQAEGTIDVLPFFTGASGELEMGWHWINDYHAIPNLITQARSAAHTLLGLDETTPAPKVSLLTIFCHGLRTKINLAHSAGGYDGAGSLRVDRVPEFVKIIKDHVTENLVIPLFACNTGAGDFPNPDGPALYGTPYPCEELGGNSLAWILLNELNRQGITRATIWAHTTAQHTTRNPNLRVFSPWGSANMVNLLLQHPNIPRQYVLYYLACVNYDSKTQAPALFRKRLHNANLLRAMSLQSALYLPWKWDRGTDPSAQTPGFNQEAKNQARAIFDEFRSLLPPDATGEAEDVIYEDATRSFVIGLKEGLVDAPLSEHFSYSDLSSLMKPFRIEVQLMKYVQLLRYRTKVNMVPREVIEAGQGLVLEAAPNTQEKRDLMSKKAATMVAAGFFKSAVLIEGRLYVSHSGLRYDAGWNYIVGKNPGVGDPKITPDLAYSAFETKMSPMHLNRQLVQRLQDLVTDLKTTFPVKSIRDSGDTIEIDAGSQAQRVLAQAQEYCSRGSLTRAAAGSGPGTVSISLRN